MSCVVPFAAIAIDERARAIWTQAEVTLRVYLYFASQVARDTLLILFCKERTSSSLITAKAIMLARYYMAC